MGGGWGKTNGSWGKKNVGKKTASQRPCRDACCFGGPGEKGENRVEVHAYMRGENKGRTIAERNPSGKGNLGKGGKQNSQQNSEETRKGVDMNYPEPRN